MKTNNISKHLLGILFAAAVAAGCAVDDGAPDPEIEGPSQRPEAVDTTLCTAACRTLLGGCFEELDRTAVAICRDDCEDSGLDGFDLECLAADDCSGDSSDCVID